MTAVAPSPLVLRWQGVLAQQRVGWLGQHLELIAGVMLCALMAWLPQISRGGLTLLITASGLLWILWALRTPPGRLGAVNLWILAILAVALLATGFSPVPVAAVKGLAKLVAKYCQQKAVPPEEAVFRRCSVFRALAQATLD